MIGSGDLLNELKIWHEELSFLKEYSIQRCLSTETSCVDIHTFADAVAYSRQTIGNGEFYAKFTCFKHRVCPIN